MNWNEFISNEKVSLDTIDVKRIYIDIAGDLVSGVLLSQIVYWHLPSKSSKTRLTVEKDGEYWLAKKRYDWWDECRITPKQFDRAIKVLEERQMVITQVFRYNGDPTKHIRINRDTFVAVYNAMLSEGVEFVKFQGGKWILTKGEERNLPLGNNELPERGISKTPRKPMPAVASTLAENGHRLPTEITTDIINGFSEKSELTNPQTDDDCGKNVENSLPHAQGDDFYLAIEQKMSDLGVRTSLSAVDSQAMAKVKKAGVSIDLVLVTLDEVFQRNKDSPHAKNIRSFGYFVPAIMEAHEVKSKVAKKASSERERMKKRLEEIRKEIDYDH